MTNEVEFVHNPGWKVAVPSNAEDAVGLLRESLRGNDPVLFFEHRAMLDDSWARRPWPGDDYVLPFGRAKKTREGDAITIVTWGAMVPRCEAAAEGVSADVIDLRTLHAVGPGHGAGQRSPHAPLPDRPRGSAHRRLWRGNRRGGRRRGLPRPRRAGGAGDHARHPEPASSEADGMGAALGRTRSAPKSSGWWGSEVIDVRVPDEQEGTKAVVRAWLRQVGDLVFENEPLVELETDKVTQEVPAPAAGVLAEIVLDTDAEAVPGALLARIDTEGSPAEAGAQGAAHAAPSSVAAADAAPGPRPAPGNGETRLTPSVRRACLQHGIDPSRIQGTGRNGRVTREDVDRAVASATVVSVGEPATAQPRHSRRRTSRTTACG